MNEISPDAAKLARWQARRFAARLPRHIDADDLLPVALLAAWKAEQAFDRTRGTKPSTVIVKYVQTALRRHVETENRLVGQQREDGQYWLSLDALDEDGCNGILARAASPTVIGEDGLTLGMRFAEVATAMALLPDRERQVLELQYLAGLTQRQVAQQWGLSAARIYQLHTKGVRRLREALG